MQQLLLLHGALGSKAQWDDLSVQLADSFIVHSMNFSGHGGNGLPDAEFSIPLFAAEVLDFLDRNRMDSIAVFGYSMGGYVAMYLAKHYPGRVQKLITLATKFDWNETIAAREAGMLNAATIAEKLPGFAAVLRERHAPGNWEILLKKTASMLLAMGKDNPLKQACYSQIQHPVLLMLGDRDKMVSLDETLEVYQLLPNAQLSLLPGTKHPLETVNAKRLAFEVVSFLG